MKEQEGNFDKARRYLSYVDIAAIIAGGLLGLPGLAMGGAFSQALDQSLGKEASRWLKKRRDKK